MTALYQAWEELAVFAEGLRAGRAEGYPGLVRVGKMTPAEADHGIAVMTALAEIWRAAFECRLPDPDKIGLIDDTDISIDLLTALERIDRQIARIPDSPVLHRQKARLEAMLYWHRRHTQGPIWCVRITLAWRALRDADDARKDAA